VAEALAAGKLSFAFVDLPHWRWASVGSKSYRELAAEEELPLDLVQDVVQAVGYLRPEPDDRVRDDDPAVFSLIRLAAQRMDRDALLRTARVYVEALRRVADAETTLFDRYFVGPLLEQGLDYAQAADLANALGAEFTPLQEQMILTLYRREQERRWTEYSIEGIESVLEEMGLYHRPDRPPAFSFVDLAGYTRMVEERGDEAGARIAADLGHMVDQVVGARQGTPVKWLGDGVMLYFRDPGPALLATMEMVRRAPDVGLPAHAGMSAGPVVLQDGEYYGRTVNMAARIASEASAGQTLVSGEVAELASGQGVDFREIGSIDLKGFRDAVTLYEAIEG
jgi:adenylate cyclase